MFTPLNGMVLIEKQAVEMKTAGGIIITSTTSSDENDIGVVVDFAPEVTKVQVGNKVLLKWKNAIKYNDTLYFVPADDLVAVEA